MLIKGDKKLIRGWAMYDWANSVYSLTITSAVFPMFYLAVTHDNGSDLILDRYNIPSQSLYSFTLSFGFLIVAVITPLLAGIADHTGGKKKFLKFFCYLGSAACASLFFFDVYHIWLGMLSVVLASIGFSASLIFYDAYLPEIAEPKDHDRISAQGFTMGYIGSVILLVINLAMVMSPASFGIPDTDGMPARLTFVTVGIWWAAFAQITFARLPDNIYGQKASENYIKKGYLELKKVWNQLRRTKRLKRFLMAFFAYNSGIQTVMYLAVSYAKEEIKEINETGELVPIGDDSLIISILIIQLVAAVGAYFFFKLSSRIGNLKSLMLAATIWVGIVIMAYFIHYASSFYIMAAGVGFVMGGSQALSRSTYSKFLPETIDHASYFSFYDVCYYVGTVFGTAVYGLVFYLTNDLRYTIVAIGSFFVVGLILLIRVPQNEVLREEQVIAQ